MSQWTYVHGIISVYVPGRTQPEIQYILDTVLEHLPKVTGSEGNMNVHTIKRSGYNGFSNTNEFGEFSLGYYDSFKTQDIYDIVLEGALRDRTYKETFAEVNKFLNRLAKRLSVEYILVEVRDCYGNSYLFNNHKPYADMCESPSWSEEGEVCWWEYLMWNRGAETDYPIALEQKYYGNKENDEEFKRRRKWQANH